MPCPPPEDLPDPATEPMSPALADESLTTEPPGKPICVFKGDSVLGRRNGKRKGPEAGADLGVCARNGKEASAAKLRWAKRGEQKRESRGAPGCTGICKSL